MHPNRIFTLGVHSYTARQVLMNTHILACSSVSFRSYATLFRYDVCTSNTQQRLVLTTGKEQFKRELLYKWHF
jgi:hypothetical protein